MCHADGSKASIRLRDRQYAYGRIVTDRSSRSDNPGVFAARKSRV